MVCRRSAACQPPLKWMVFRCFTGGASLPASRRSLDRMNLLTAIRRNYTPLQLITHASAAVLAAWLIWEYSAGPLNINPIQTAMQHTGKTALIFLMLSLACTPVNTVFGWRQALSARRALGLYAFLFAAAHLTIFAWVDFGLDWLLIGREIIEKNYILIGMAALSILLALAITSFNWWKKRLGKNWKRLHRLAYLAGALVTLHYAWAKKGDLFSLKGDVFQPLAFGVIVILLLILRIPAVRKWSSGLRGRWLSFARS